MARPLKSRPPIDKVVEVIREERGLLALAAERLGMTRTDLRKYIGSRPTCAAVLKECREALGDLAERKLYDLIEAGDFRAITYYLSTMGKSRGYVLPHHVTLDQSINNNLVIQSVEIVAVPSGSFLREDGSLSPPRPPDGAPVLRLVEGTSEDLPKD